MTSRDSSEGAGKEGWVMEVDECLKVLTASSSIFDNFAKMGVKVDGDPGEKLRHVRKTMEGLKTQCLTGKKESAGLTERVKLLEAESQAKDGGLEELKLRYLTGEKENAELKERVKRMELLEEHCKVKDQALEQMKKDHSLERERRAGAESELRNMKAAEEMRKLLTIDQQPKVTSCVTGVAVQTEPRDSPLLPTSRELGSSNQAMRPDPPPQEALMDPEVPPQDADVSADMDSQEVGAEKNLEGDSLSMDEVENLDKSSGMPMMLQPTPESVGSAVRPKPPAPVNCSGSGQEFLVETLRDVLAMVNADPDELLASVGEGSGPSQNSDPPYLNGDSEASSHNTSAATPTVPEPSSNVEGAPSLGVDSDSTPGEVSQGGEHQNRSPVADPSDDKELGEDEDLHHPIRIVDANDPSVFDAGTNVDDGDFIPAPTEPAATVPQVRRSQRLHETSAKISTGGPSSTTSVSHSKSRRTSSPGQQLQTHNPDSQRYFCCPVCFKVFYTSDKLALHKKVHRPRQEKTFKCSHQEKSDGNAGTSVENEGRTTPAPTKSPALPSVRRSRRPAVSSAKPLVGTSRSTSPVHKSRRTSSPVSDLFATPASGGGGDRSGKRFKCNRCPRRFRRSTELKSHQRVHSQCQWRKQTQCLFCGKGFRSFDELVRHTHVHTGERPYFCKVCKSEFRSRDDLNRHMRGVHQGESGKIYGCRFCDKKCADQGDCLKHQRTHHKGREIERFSFCDKNVCNINSCLRFQQT